MKLLFIYLLLLLAPKTKSDFVKPSYKNKFFTLVKSTKAKWVSGAPEGKGGAGIDYDFEINFTKDFDGYIKMIWVGNMYLDTKYRNTDSIKDYNHFKKGTNVTIYGSEIIRSSYINNTKRTTDPPFKYDGVAMIEYVYKNKTYCYVVKNWSEEKKIDGI
jgi:hypothetical protein